MIKYRPRKIKFLVAMAEKGLNQKTLSEKSGLNPSTISNFLNGRHGISPSSAKKIADVLEKNIKEIFEFEVNDIEVSQ